MGGSRLWGAVAAAWVAVASPSFLFMARYRDDAALGMPQRLNVLVKWGEGPHMSALALIPWALLFAWHALRGRSNVAAVLAGLFSALVVAHNFYGALALAVMHGLLAWSIAITEAEPRVIARAAAIGLLSYGLCAFWLTPSYIDVTLENLRLVAQPGKPWSRAIALAAVAVFAAMSWWRARGKRTAAYPVFLIGCVLLFTLIVAGHYFFDLRIAGEPHRLVPELDLVCLLAAAELLRRVAARGGWRAIGSVALACGVFVASARYLADPWSVFVPARDYRDRVEFRVSDRIARELPGARTFAPGSIRFWYDAWRNEAQVSGGSDQGLLNGTIALAYWQITKDEVTGRDVAWLQAMGADAVVVEEQSSEVRSPDFTAPRKFAGVLPVLYDAGRGTVVYKVPRRFSARARIVRTAEAEALPPIPVSNENQAEIKAYARTVEEGPDRVVELHREGPGCIVLRAAVQQGESLVVQDSFDPAWRAYSGGQELPIRKDAVGFMLITPPPGEREVRLVFELPLENKVGRTLSGFSVLIAALVVWRSLKRRQVTI
jgi:hypothetical protein